MTSAEKNVVRGLIALAWADGQIAEGELGVIEGLLCTYEVTPEEEAELLEFARTPRTVEHDVPVDELDAPERELLLTNGILLVGADGVESESEFSALQLLVRRLGVSQEYYQRLLVQTRDAVPKP